MGLNTPIRRLKVVFGSRNWYAALVEILTESTWYDCLASGGSVAVVLAYLTVADVPTFRLSTRARAPMDSCR